MRASITKLTAGKKKGPAVKVTSGTVLVAAEFGGWQRAVLEVAQGIFDSDTRSWPADTDARVMEAVAAHPDLEGMNEKRRKGAVMPFLKFRKEQAVMAGETALG